MRARTADPAALAALAPTGQPEARLKAGGRVVQLTNPGKVVWPADGITRGDLLRYYAEVSPWLLPHLKDRPVVMKRCQGIHVYAPIRRGPEQKCAWRFAKALAFSLAERHPALVTAVYRIAKRPAGRVLVDYNQTAWGRTLASVSSVRPKPGAPVSTPVTWEEIETRVEVCDFRIRDLPARLRQRGDLWRKLLRHRGRFDLESVS